MCNEDKKLSTGGIPSMTAVENSRPDQVPRQPSRSMRKCPKHSFRDHAVNKIDAEESQEADCEGIVHIHGISRAANLSDNEAIRGEKARELILVPTVDRLKRKKRNTVVVRGACFKN